MESQPQRVSSVLAGIPLATGRKILLCPVRVLASSPTAAASVVIIAIIIAAAVFAPTIGRHDPIEVSLLERLKPPAWQEGGDWKFLLGTDQLGRDIASRVIHGARISLLIAVPASLIAMALGITIGLWSAYAGGATDRFIMRWVDFQRSIPLLLVAILVMAFVGRGLLPLILFLGFWGWNDYCRVVRGQALSIQQNVYIEAARSIGCSGPRIMFKHVFPNLVASIIILATFFLPTLIIIESALSYLGLGVPQPAPSWGNMLADGRSQINTAPWLIWPAAAVLSLTVLACNMLGDWLRDTWDPRLRGVR